jgi:hypothetical protein
MVSFLKKPCKTVLWEKHVETPTLTKRQCGCAIHYQLIVVYLFIVESAKARFLYVIEGNISLVSQMDYNSTNPRVIGGELSTKNTTSVVIEQLVYYGSAAEHLWNELLQEAASCVQKIIFPLPWIYLWTKAGSPRPLGLKNYECTKMLSLSCRNTNIFHQHQRVLVPPCVAPSSGNALLVLGPYPMVRSCHKT